MEVTGQNFEVSESAKGGDYKVNASSKSIKGMLQMEEEVKKNVAPNPSNSEGNAKNCELCGKTKTPRWRRGPSGLQTICNVCGIRYLKEEKAGTGTDSEAIEPAKKKNKGHYKALLIRADP